MRTGFTASDHRPLVVGGELDPLRSDARAEALHLHDAPLPGEKFKGDQRPGHEKADDEKATETDPDPHRGESVCGPGAECRSGLGAAALPGAVHVAADLACVRRGRGLGLTDDWVVV